MKGALLFPLILAVSLSACLPAAPRPATLETADTMETAEASSATSPQGSPFPEEAAVSWPEGLQAMDLAVLPYDEIRLVYHFARFAPPLSGYYTVSKEGRWGLIRNDGSEVLPCVFDAPIALCSDTEPLYPSWIARREDGDDDFWTETQQYLTSVGEGRICDGAHCGPGYEMYFWDESCDQMFAYEGSLGPSEPSHISLGMQKERGWWFPTRPGTLVEEPWGQGVQYDEAALYQYRSAEGTPINTYAYDQAELFYDGALLAAARRGDKWLYLDGSGREVTAPSYDPVYWNSLQEIGYASPLLRGYAAVTRDGKFGLLDSAGLEYLPCGYDGVAWDGGVGWLKLSDGWHGFRIPSASQQTPLPCGSPAAEDHLRGIPLTVVFPDTIPGAERRTQYTTIRDDNLKVRAGPGTEYEQIGRIPPGSAVEELGTSSTVSGWTFVGYQDWLRGWVSSQYLE